MRVWLDCTPPIETNRIHGEQLIALPGLRQTRTFFVMKEVVDSAPLDF
jgi:Lrp/AsnC family leucine-responsive transcriptional regulator